MVSALPVDSPSANSASYLPPHDGVDCITKITGPGVTTGIGETGEEWSRNTSIGRDGAILFFLEQIEWLSIKGSSLTLVGVWQTTSHNHVTGLHSSEPHYRLPLDENQAPASHHVASVAAKSFSRPHGNGREDEGEGPPPLQKEKAPRPKPNTIWQPELITAPQRNDAILIQGIPLPDKADCRAVSARTHLELAPDLAAYTNLTAEGEPDSLMMAQPVPHQPTDKKRVKVYELRNNDWFDRGTGFCSASFETLEDGRKDPRVIVESEDQPDRLLLETKIQKEDGFQKQQGTS
ncbi:hypothetical protein MRS44_006559 [Fusarium solani]|nr:hypothetical protein MRS44_006559 [Fusarium solani]